MCRAIAFALLRICIFWSISVSWASIEGLAVNITHMFGIPNSFYPDPVFAQIGSEYYYVRGPQSVSWYSALHNCHRVGAELISISKMETLYKIQEHRKIFSNGTKYWVDLSNLATEGDYVSMSTGRKPSFEHWCENEPPLKSTTNNCVMIEEKHSSGPCMIAVPCNGRKDYICQLRTPQTISIVAL